MINLVNLFDAHSSSQHRASDQPISCGGSKTTYCYGVCPIGDNSSISIIFNILDNL